MRIEFCTFHSCFSLRHFLLKLIQREKTCTALLRLFLKKGKHIHILKAEVLLVNFKFLYTSNEKCLVLILQK